MNVGLRMGWFIGSIMSIVLIVIPRVLQYFGLTGEIIDFIVSPWVTFLLFLIILGLMLSPWLKNKKFAIPLFVLIVVVSCFVTIYLCRLPVPW